MLNSLKNYIKQNQYEIIEHFTLFLSWIIALVFKYKYNFQLNNIFQLENKHFFFIIIFFFIILVIKTFICLEIYENKIFWDSRLILALSLVYFIIFHFCLNFEDFFNIEILKWKFIIIYLGLFIIYYFFWIKFLPSYHILSAYLQLNYAFFFSTILLCIFFNNLNLIWFVFALSNTLFLPHKYLSFSTPQNSYILKSDIGLVIFIFIFVCNALLWVSFIFY